MQKPLHSAIGAQCMNAVSTHFTVDHKGKRFMVCGESKNIVALGKTTVVLFSEDSTPQKNDVHPDAERNFGIAMERLIESGEEFYTELRPGWALPSFLWRLVGPVST